MAKVNGGNNKAVPGSTVCETLACAHVAFYRSYRLNTKIADAGCCIPSTRILPASRSPPIFPTTDVRICVRVCIYVCVRARVYVAEFLCALSANKHQIEFLEFTISDYATKNIIFMVIL